MRKFLIILLILILLLFLYCFFFRKGGCCIVSKGSGKPDTTVHWINWNILFTPSSFASSSQTIHDFEDSLTKWVNNIDPDASLSFDLHYCPCDSLLTNIDATLVSGSGKTVNPPPTTPSPGPSGDFTLAKNLDTYMAEISDSVISVLDSGYIQLHDTTHLVVGQAGTLHDKTLAVIDTGLDSALFKLVYKNTIWSGNMLWNDPAKPTLFNVVPGESNGSLIDDNAVKHGTAATYIAISQMQINGIPSNQMPKIMSIRAFDKDEKGSIYTVSCGLSYAIQHNVDYINASWGYFGAQDPVLRRYIHLADKASIRVIAAAGNSPIVHNSSDICKSQKNDLNDLDRLVTKDSLFYPACFAPDYANVVSVTQLSHISPGALPCYYQNFSSGYITVGAFDTGSTNGVCCTFSLPFLSRAIEGSSFATPAATGTLMTLVTNKTQNIKLLIEAHYKQPPFAGTGIPAVYTNMGDVIQYHQK